uniref:Uncharacterized protein n=1 Tax=Anguilla anguilla TaxID=7936 RepID=A0A0E9W8M3_ANGAN
MEFTAHSNITFINLLEIRMEFTAHSNITFINLLEIRMEFMAHSNITFNVQLEIRMGRGGWLKYNSIFILASLRLILFL